MKKVMNKKSLFVYSEQARSIYQKVLVIKSVTDTSPENRTAVFDMSYHTLVMDETQLGGFARLKNSEGQEIPSIHKLKYALMSVDVELIVKEVKGIDANKHIVFKIQISIQVLLLVEPRFNREGLVMEPLNTKGYIILDADDPNDVYGLEDGGDVRSGCIEGLAKEYQNNAQANLHMKNKKGGKEVVCSNCLGGGVLLEIVHFGGHGDNDSICCYEWLVKWTGLGYDNATWELQDASFLTSAKGRKLIRDYESRRKGVDKLSKRHFEDNEETKTFIVELSVLPFGDSPGLYNQYLSYVNKLRMCWYKGQNALIVDDQIDQDLHELRCIPWKAIIIDECQQSRISGHLDHIKTLNTEMKLLLVSGQIKLEQYCSMLLSNLILLCSGQKSDTLGALHELIISTRKCCDHPYLLEPALHNSVAKGLPVEEHLDIGIKASGKLLLLEKILLEAKSRGLRVLILFQSSCGSGSIGDILDDVLCQRFGIDCYVRYDRAYTPKTKEAALDTFNDRDSGKFVFLMENRACLPSVKLSSVDIVILFDSDFDPQNDLRGLQRMSISTQLKQLTVFRLYSYYTVEEKILMLAKEGISLDSNVRLISHSISHTLLKWGTSHLFNKLDDLHASVTAVSTPDIADQTLLHDVLCELSSQLVCDADDIDCHELSFISTIQQNGGEYSRNILLLGERIMKELGSEPSAFSWSDLEAKYPQWKFLSVSSQRMRSRVKHSDYIINESECEGHTIMGKRTASNASKKSKVSKDNFDHNLRKLAKDKVEPERRKVSKDIVETEGMEPSNHAIDPKTRKVFNGIVKSGGRKMSKKIRDSKYRKSRLRNKKNSSVSNSTSKSNGTNGLSSLLDSSGHPLANETTGETTTNIQLSEKRKLLDGPNSIKFLPKSDISGLCEILHFPCWLAASLLKHDIDKKVSLTLAKLYLNFNCNEEEATNVYSELWKHAKTISNYIQNGLCVENYSINDMPELNDLTKVKQKGFLDTRVTKLTKSVTKEHDLQMKSPTTVVSCDQTSTYEICSFPKTPASFPVKAIALSSESGSENDVMESTPLITSEDSALEHGGNDVNPRTDYLEKQSPIRSTDITQSDGKVFEDPQILVNELVAIENFMNMPIHSLQLDSDDANAVTSIGSAVPEARQWGSIMSPVCDESTGPKFAETTFPNTQPSDANLWSLPLMAMSDIPSFPEHNSASAVTPLDDIFNHSREDHCYIHEAEVILEAPNNTVEPVNSSFGSPVILKPFTSVPMNENMTHVPDSFTIPGYMNSDSIQHHYVASEISDDVYLDSLLDEMEITENTNEEAFIDPLLIAMERIEKDKEEAFKIHEKKILQLRSEYELEVEKLSEKYRILLQNVDTEVALKKMEFETQCKLVSSKSKAGIHQPRGNTQFSSSPLKINPSLLTPTVMVLDNPWPSRRNHGHFSDKTAIPEEINPLRARFDPMIQLCKISHDGYGVLVPSAAASSYAAISLDIMYNCNLSII
ncbi:Helicase protein [Vigna angularis]|uniref:Helicase protein n=1 Tax=Phaseolus angularis TaxID=3914 RepID=A0A8T0L6Y3_PHAAN|nr:Helicase protein [Vigna angularis]